MAVFFDDWTIYSLLKDHVQHLRLMLERCRQIQLSLNIFKCIFATLIGILLGHVICKDGIQVDLAKIKVILEIPPVNPKQIRILLGHTGYYRKFIRHYSGITFPMDELLRADVIFVWGKECMESFELLKMNSLKES